MLWSDETAFDSAMKWWDCIWQCYRVTAIWEMLESTRKHHRHTMHTMAYYGFGDGTMTCCGKNLSLLMHLQQPSNDHQWVVMTCWWVSLLPPPHCHLFDYLPPPRHLFNPPPLRLFNYHGLRHVSGPFFGSLFHYSGSYRSLLDI